MSDEQDAPAVEAAAPEPAPEEPPTMNPIDQIADAWAGLFAQFPKGSRADLIDGHWHFFRGPGSTAHGAGKTLSRAIAAVNSSRAKNPDTGRMEEVAEDGTVLPPE